MLQGLIFSFKKNQDYGAKLVADLSSEDMVRQPVADLPSPANHPAWVLSHLNVYLPIIECLIQGQSFPDPKEHRYGMLSRPLPDTSEYAPKEELVAEFVESHQRIIDLLEQSEETILSQPVTLERWKPIMPLVGIALPYLMLFHENGHLGQVSAWRRVLGLPSV
jgi:hypothetical protein